MRPQIVIICHTDFSESNPNGPMLPFDRQNPETWNRIFDDLGRVAHVDSIAIGCRGTFDPSAVAALPIAREAYLRASHHPTLTFWGDTVGLPDIAHNVSGGGGFDFANPQHIQWAWEHFLNHFIVNFGDLHLTRSPNGKVLILWWGIAKNNGWGFVNRQHAQRLLDSVDAHFVALGLGGADHIVDTTWLDDAPNLRVWGVHNWFSGHHNPQSYSTRTHRGVTVGVVVPGFTDPTTGVHTIPHGGETARAGLRACSGCHVVICEGATDFAENAHWIRDAAGDDSKLTAIRDITYPIGDDMSIRGTFSLRRSEATPHPNEAGYHTSPYPGSNSGEVFSVQPPDGDVEPRPAGTHGAYESWREEGNRAVFDKVAGYTFAFPLVD